VFTQEEGLSWIDGAGRRQSLADWQNWLGKRAQAGRMQPKGLPKNQKFAPRDPAIVARAADSA
jgi:topoisomerase-4 subunit A